MKTVLLTGASGFIGRHCLEALTKRGFSVHAVSSKEQQNFSRPEVMWHRADLHNGEHVLRLMAEVQPRYLLHLAWDVTPGFYWSSMENLRWVRTSLGLLQAFTGSGGERAVLAGSCAEYDWEYGYCKETLTPLNPGTLYGVCKKALQSMVEAAAVEAQVSCAWGRLFFLFGPGEHVDRLVPSVITSLLQQEEVLCTHGEQVRDYIYVKDAADAFAALLESDINGPVNIASGRPVLLKELIGRTAQLIGRPGLVRLGALSAAADDPPLLLAETRRLKSVVRWQESYSLEAGLAETISWWKKKLGRSR